MRANQPPSHATAKQPRIAANQTAIMPIDLGLRLIRVDSFVSPGENGQESDFDREGFVNITV
jgi:hypothetical protein